MDAAREKMEAAREGKDEKGTHISLPGSMLRKA